MNKIIKDFHRKEQQKKSPAEQHMKEIFVRLRSLIESLWDEMNIKIKKRDKFIKKYYYPETLTNYMHVYQEINRLCKIRSAQHIVLKHIEQREVYISRIKEISKSVSSQDYDCYLVLKELPALVECVRETSVKLLEAIVTWRHQLPEKQVFEYHGTNYVLTMQTDLDFLKTTEIADLFDFPLDSNPLLLHSAFRWKDASHSSKDNVTTTQTVKGAANTNPSTLVTKKTRGSTSLPHIVDTIKKSSTRITGNILPELAEKYIQTDRIIFQEEQYIDFIRQQKQRHNSSIIIQCFTRRILSYKIVIIILAERQQQEAAKALQLSNSAIKMRRRMEPSRSSSTQETSLVGTQSTQPLSEEHSKMLLDDFMKQQQASSFLGPSTKMNGRYSGILFNPADGGQETTIK